MFNIDFRNPKPIYEQLTESIEKLAIKGVLKPDEQLPSVRQLAMELSINPNTIQRAYSLLESKGITYSIKGRGSFISPNCIDCIKNKLEFIRDDIKRLIEEARDIGATDELILSWLK
ncbi:GntR family transcriptional regulator [[Clostridium] colinum]|uniref:GntR family transcriptional regulator n=1 Tax=[Clostridium] colinum TaxID=36835 RepID=UPI002024CE07|nr:GntR family transcriptional regulator [[Clostridium] colinum]